ncbi:hypothetical protein PBY51_022055 [Eleginops maclovinus]|uniref:Rubicon Homology domain-containing protein n=1 Tax=Eleginops maclovinus TaxID=56733 RepID=A0AAN8AF93_ELEMC|nr:hypothetical protein PBY51_022055 [Eleginops maclovinus]
MSKYMMSVSSFPGDCSQNHPQETGFGSVPLLLLSPPETASNHQRLQPNTDPTAHNTNADGGEEGRKSLMDPGDESFLLPRSSPVLSRQFRPVSWDGPQTSSPPSMDSSSAAAGSQWGGIVEDLGSSQPTSTLQEDRKSTCAVGEQGLAEEHRGRGQISHDAPASSGLSTSTLSKESRSSDIPEFSAEIFKSCCDLDKENAHFVVVDMMLEDEEDEEAGSEEAQHPPKTFSVLSTDSGFEDGGVDTPQTDSLRNAERLAEQLVLEFRRRWFPSHEPRRGQLSLRSSLQELPGTGALAVSSSRLAEEIRLRTRMRGSLSWAPPRFQMIFTVQPTLRRSEVVALQHFLCAGCGTELERRYIKKLRYCEYLGRYFCDCCHGGSEAVIPGRILSCWDFTRYPVSDFSKQLLDSVWDQPLFNLTCVGKGLYSRVKELEKFREVQDQLVDIRKLLSACRFSALEKFDELPAPLMQRPPLFSMEDLKRVRKGQLLPLAKTLLHTAVQHVESCELCLARGFICEFCRERDVIFPFQRDKCRRCAACRACFHKHCFVEKKCPKCERIKSRRRRPDGSTQ